ncbi:MAG TPA: beta-eliminating lyase-related protein [Hyphomonas sp.]|nr:beta-eliminating lyase-related protein [Hyphomonas sp.]HRX73130.1 beta-eliminating lyase-related protein [Hyphomonas sp.]
MNFASDTSAPAHPKVVEAILAVNTGMEASYGGDTVMAALRAKLATVFETEDFDYWITVSGTASNALALATLCSPMGAVLCHEEAHIQRDERGAPEFFMGGGKLQLLPGFGARIDRDALEAALAGIQRDFLHETPAEVLSLTNLTECGTAYRAAEVALYAGMAREKGLFVHLDGSRLGNLLAGSTASAAEMTWKAGVDVLSFGLSKTGAIGCEVIVLFGRARTKFTELKIRAKRAGHMPPKMRFLAAQAHAMLDDALWLELARGANARAQKLADVFMAAGLELAYPADGNEVFALLPEDVAKRLWAAGAKFYPWPGNCYRFVCSWCTSADEVAAVAAALKA